jgi:hypothetical protein
MRSKLDSRSNTAQSQGKLSLSVANAVRRIKNRGGGTGLQQTTHTAAGEDTASNKSNGAIMQPVAMSADVELEALERGIIDEDRCILKQMHISVHTSSIYSDPGEDTSAVEKEQPWM